MKKWSCSNALKRLSGFLVHTGYYCKFVANYGNIVAPLTTLLKRNGFSWHDKVEKDFLAVKKAMCAMLGIAMLDFIETFTLEYNAFSHGLGAILSYEGCPLAFNSKHLCDRNLGKSSYEK